MLEAGLLFFKTDINITQKHSECLLPGQWPLRPLHGLCEYQPQPFWVSTVRAMAAMDNGPWISAQKGHWPGLVGSWEQYTLSIG